MARVRTQKAVASRIDLNYHRKPHPWRRTRLGLVILATLAAGAWFAFSSVRFSNGRPMLVDKIHNPGPVARAHAQFEHDCRKCHDGNGENGYWLNVSDAACIQCHDGSLHHMNQKMADAHGGADKAQLIMAVKEIGPEDKSPTTHPSFARDSSGRTISGMSANCVSCHIEHRGHDALAGTSDQHCITCHENVNNAMQPGTTPQTAARVVAFTTADHPRFGRTLDQSASASGEFNWSDTTDLKYNHSHPRHSGIPNLPGATTNCTRCHEVSNVPVAVSEDQSYPPFGSASGSAWASGSDKSAKYVQPVSYERHCIGCHQMKLPSGGPTVPHEDMSIVRASLLGLSAELLGGLRSMSAEDRKKELTETKTQGVRKTQVEIKESDWLAKKLKGVSDQVNRSVTSSAGAEMAARLGASGNWIYEGESVKGPSVAAMEFYVAFASSESCARCHSMNVPATSFGAAPATGPATAPAAAPLLATLPTGIPDLPRRWFGSSHFDHYAHRQMDCLGCHNAATKSAKTSDVLTADIDGKYSGATHLGVDAAARSCVSCHHPTAAAGAGAPSNCVTCHEYHDHRFERSLDNPFSKELAPSAAATPAGAPSSAPGQ